MVTQFNLWPLSSSQQLSSSPCRIIILYKIHASQSIIPTSHSLYFSAAINLTMYNYQNICFASQCAHNNRVHRSAKKNYGKEMGVFLVKVMVAANFRPVWAVKVGEKEWHILAKHERLICERQNDIIARTANHLKFLPPLFTLCLY